MTVSSVAVKTTLSYLTFVIAWLIVLLARLIFCLCLRFCMCMDTRNCDCKCHIAWTAIACLIVSIGVIAQLRYHKGREPKDLQLCLTWEGSQKLRIFFRHHKCTATMP